MSYFLIKIASVVKKSVGVFFYLTLCLDKQLQVLVLGEKVSLLEVDLDVEAEPGSVGGFWVNFVEEGGCAECIDITTAFCYVESLAIGFVEFR